MPKAASKSPAAEPIAPMRPKESLPKSPESVREDSRLKRRSSPKLPSSEFKPFSSLKLTVMPLPRSSEPLMPKRDVEEMPLSRAKESVFFETPLVSTLECL